MQLRVWCKASQYLVLQIAIVITASITRWVYAFGSDSTAAQEKMIAKAKPAQGFFASLNSFASFLGSSTPVAPLDTRTPLQKLPDSEKIEVIECSVQLRIYTGEIGVKLPPKIASEIERATRKKTPSNMNYQIVFVSLFAKILDVVADAEPHHVDG